MISEIEAVNNIARLNMIHQAARIIKCMEDYGLKGRIKLKKPYFFFGELPAEVLEHGVVWI